MYRIGQSTDIHQLVSGRELVLGGVHIPSEIGTLGHSDGDALCHAIAEAILGALCLGDLGKHFKDTDPKWEGISSLIILQKVKEMMIQHGYRINNIDSLILIEKPKMAQHIEQMRKNIAQTLECAMDQVSIKATRGEKLGYIGRSEGVCAQAVVLLVKE